MDSCYICLENCPDSFKPEVGDTLCHCKYTVHEDCYKKWLETSNMVYNCIICHKTIKTSKTSPGIHRIVFIFPYLINIILFLFVIILFSLCFSVLSIHISHLKKINYYRSDCLLFSLHGQIMKIINNQI